MHVHVIVRTLQLIDQMVHDRRRPPEMGGQYTGPPPMPGDDCERYQRKQLEAKKDMKRAYQDHLVRHVLRSYIYV